MHPKHLRDDRAAVLVITIQCFVSEAKLSGSVWMMPKRQVFLAENSSAFHPGIHSSDILAAGW